MWHSNHNYEKYNWLDLSGQISWTTLSLYTRYKCRKYPRLLKEISKNSTDIKSEQGTQQLFILVNTI